MSVPPTPSAHFLSEDNRIHLHQVVFCLVKESQATHFKVLGMGITAALLLSICNSVFFRKELFDELIIGGNTLSEF